MLVRGACDAEARAAVALSARRDADHTPRCRRRAAPPSCHTPRRHAGTVPSRVSTH